MQPVLRGFQGKRSRLSFFLLLVISLCISLSILLTAWLLWQNRVLQIRQLENQATHLAQAIERHADDTFKEADTVLVSVVSAIEFQQDVPPPGRKPLDALLQRHVRELDKLSSLLILSPSGEMIAGSDNVPQRLNFADRDYFNYHLVHASLRPHLGATLRSRINGEWIIPLSRRFNDADGQFGGVVVATIKLSSFLAFYRQFDILQQGALALTYQDALLVRRPLVDTDIGRNLANTLVVQQARVAPNGRITTRSPLDGIERIVSYRQLQGFPVIATAALGKAESLVAWNRLATYTCALLLVSVLVFGALGLHLVRQIDTRLAAEKALHLAKADLERLNRQLEGQALQDGLTGLANRRCFDLTLQREFARAQREGLSLAVVMLDIDHFKHYNDTLGHPGGDACLRSIARIAAAIPSRDADLVARYGGEEIALILPGATLAGAWRIAERIRQAVAGSAHPPLFTEQAGQVTLSGGVAAAIPKQGEAPTQLLEAADQALYAAKASGRNRVVQATQDGSEPAASTAAAGPGAIPP